jgi:hypothetical protein
VHTGSAGPINLTLKESTVSRTTWKRTLGLAALLAVGGAAIAQPPDAPTSPPAASTSPAGPSPDTGPGGFGPGPTGESNIPLRPSVENPDAATYGPTPFLKVNILNDLIYGDNAKDAPIKFAGWADFDYTYRSTGSGRNNIAPVMNRFGNEFLARELGLYVYKPLDPKELSWGFNAMFMAGADASFLGPTAGGWRNTNPRFGSQFTDLNLTAHLPILTEGGVDIKAGRQTTVIGSQAAQSWGRVFNSSDYAWYNLEEGRYTGVSANWIISKQLSWYNGVELGGWGTFYRLGGRTTHVNYISQVNYWLDEEAKKTKVWASVLTGPTNLNGDKGPTHMWELAVLHNYSEQFYQILEFQGVYSKAPVFGDPAPGYRQRAYDVYTILGYHITPTVDLNGRLEWYKDVDGGGYPGGFGTGKNNFYAGTIGINYHPVKWLQLRPEIRYDQADNPAFGRDYNRTSQLSISMDALFLF